MSLRRQILQNEAISWLLLLVVGVAVFLGVNRHAESVELQKRAQAQLVGIEAILNDVQDAETGWRGFLLTGLSPFLEPYTRAQAQLTPDAEAQLTLLVQDPTTYTPQQQTQVRNVQTNMATWFRDVAEPEIAARQQNPNAVTNLAVQQRGKQLVDNTRNALDQYKRTETAIRDQRTEDANRALRFLQWLTVIALAGAVAISFITGNLLARSVAQTATRLVAGAQRLAGGNFGERVMERGPDELAQLARSFNVMAEKLEAARDDLAGQNLALAVQAETLERAGAVERTFTAVLRVFTASYDRDTILRDLLCLLDERHGFVVGAIYRYDEWSGMFTVAASHGTTPDLPPRIGLHEGIVGQAVRDRRLVVVEDSPLLTLHTGLHIASARYTMIAPVYYQDRIMGALALAHPTMPDATLHNFIAQLAQQFGIALQNLDQYANLQKLSRELQERQAQIERSNRELARADQLKSEFLANMSHELRTPLNAIIGFAELLGEQFYGPLNAEQRDYLDNIRTSGEHLLALINDILDLSKIEAGRMELSREMVRLPDLLQSSLTIVKEKAHDGRVDLTYDAGDTGEIIADARKLKQVLFNLLSNAVKFTPAGGSIRLTARTVDDGAGVEIAVTDTGIGIRAEDQDKLFREFTQLDGSLSRRHDGTGLGLALTKRLVELHGGTISVRSAFGAGSTFTIHLPATSPIQPVERSSPTVELAAVPAPPAAPSPENAPLVLIIEDDDSTATLIAAYLRSGGYRSARAANGAEGLQLARRLKPHGITLDVMMPVLDGWVFLEEAARDPLLAEIPVVVMSVASDANAGWTLGASAVLNKPVRREDLFQALSKLRITPGTQSGARVLIVDDDPKAIELVGDYLVALGHHALKAYSGAEGIALAQQERPDLILLDLMMPEMDGFVVVDRLRERAETHAIPIIILTAKIVSPQERERLNGYVEAVAEKSGMNRAAFLSEVNRALRHMTAGSRQ